MGQILNACRYLSHLKRTRFFILCALPPHPVKILFCLHQNIDFMLADELAVLEKGACFFLEMFGNKGSSKAGAFGRWSAIWVGFCPFGRWIYPLIHLFISVGCVFQRSTEAPAFLDLLSCLFPGVLQVRSEFDDGRLASAPRDQGRLSREFDIIILRQK
jgi:hypothetical protein